MKTLKEELQEIVDEDKLNNNSWFICIHLSSCNRTEFKKYRNMALNYAKDYVTKDDYVWWHTENPYVIYEKYRLIKDLIKTL